MSRLISNFPKVFLSNVVKTRTIVNVQSKNKLCNALWSRHAIIKPFNSWNVLQIALFSSEDCSAFTFRSHTCGELKSKHLDQEVVICGWLQYKRLNFMILRDSYGTVQVLLNEKYPLKNVHLESVLKVKGVVKLRPQEQINQKMETGEIEIIPSEIEVLGESKPILPFSIREFSKVNETTRLQYRYLDLRHFKMQRNLRLRSKFVQCLRNYLIDDQGFVDVETPTLFKRTPGGAQEFLVPTQIKGKFYSLTQSPQQFKQLLMIGAIDRYFQVAKCYRDEATKKDRQPEFTQLDLEMSFVTSDDIINITEQILLSAWPKDEAISVPFPRMSYKDALVQYGTDKPDLRYHSKINNITPLVNNSDCTFLKSNDQLQHFSLIIDKKDITGETEKELKDILRFPEKEKLYVIDVKSDLSWKSSIKKHVSSQFQYDLNSFLKVKPNQRIFLTSGMLEKSCQLLGKVRETICKFIEFPKSFKFLWVTDFPLFELDGDLIESVHHPFTAPHPDDVKKLDDTSLLTEIRGQHYDLVLNGEEIGGGSVRINSSKLQRHILQNILKEDADQFQYFLDALDSGCPPHAGIALGVDRVVSILCQEKSIREVIAFPKSYEGKDPMSDAPAIITEKDKKLYFL